MTVEVDFIKTVFEKFKHLDNTPVVRNKVSQTRRAETRIKYYSRDQIVIEDMYDDLNMYKVPINVVVNPRVSAHLSFATQPISKEDMDKWCDAHFVDIVVPQKDPMYFLRPAKPPIVKAVAPVKSTTRVNKQEKHSKLLKALTATSAATPTTTPASVTTTTGPVEKTKSYNIAKLLSTTTASQNTVPKTVSLVTTVPQVRLPTRISNEVSLVAKPSSVAKSTQNNVYAPIYTNIMFRLPISTQNAPQSVQVQRYPPARGAQVQHNPQPSFPYIKEDPDRPPQPTPVEVAPTPPKALPPAAAPPSTSYANMTYRLAAPPMHNQNELYLKQEKDVDDNLYTPPQYNRNINGPNISYQNHVYRMPLSKPPPHLAYNQSYPQNQPPRYRPPQERKNATLLNNQQYYNANHHQNGMRYRSVSGGSLMVLPNTANNQEGSLLSQIPPPPNLNPMPATHLLQSMNHNLAHHPSLNQMNHHSQQNHVNTMYMNSSKQPSIGKMSPISSAPSPLHSIPSPVETKPLSSPINTLPPSLNNYNNNSYNANNASLYDHSYADTYSNNSYSDNYSSSYLPPQPPPQPQQYIPPYSPHSHMDIDPFVDQMLQQAAGSSNSNKLRVKQPWELNQV